MSLIERIDKKKLPEHVAIIMDGNGRWAKQKGKARIFGHKNGAESVRRVVEAAVEIGIEYLSLYTFSKENWKRSKTEINALMSLLISTINKETKTLMDNNVRFLIIGDSNDLSTDVRAKLNATIQTTSKNSGLTLILAISYGSRWEIVEASRKLINDVLNKQITIEDVSEKTFRNYLTTSQIPDPELLIRTSGEFRISNFMLWQIAYTELYFTERFWPEFSKDDFYNAIIDFQSRERRFGKTSEQLKQNYL